MRHRDLSARIEPTFTTTVMNSTDVVTSSDPRIMEIFGVGAKAAGKAVTETSAMRVSAAYACVRIIAGAISSMPIDIYRRKGLIKQKLNEDHDFWWFLNEEPHARWTASALWKWMIKCELLRGDGFAHILRNRNGVPIGLKPLVSDYVSVEIVGDRLRYYWIDDQGQNRGADQDDVLHFPGFGFDGRRGMSAIQWGARSGIGISLATDEFAGDFFAKGALVKHAIEAPGKMTQPQVDLLRAQWEERYAGQENTYKPMILTEGLTVKELSLSAQDSQLLESRKFQVIDVARAFGVPPFMIAETEKTSSWGSGIEHMSLGFVKYTLGDRLVSMEQELNRKLFRTSGLLVKFNVDELLRGDSAARSKFLREMVGGSNGPGIISIDEARSVEGWEPKGGEASKLYVPKKDTGTDNKKAKGDEEPSPPTPEE